MEICFDGKGKGPQMSCLKFKNWCAHFVCCFGRFGDYWCILTALDQLAFVEISIARFPPVFSFTTLLYFLLAAVTGCLKQFAPPWSRKSIKFRSRCHWLLFSESASR